MNVISYPAWIGGQTSQVLVGIDAQHPRVVRLITPDHMQREFALLRIAGGIWYLNGAMIDARYGEAVHA